MGRELLSAFAQHRALTALLIVLVALLIFVSIKAARAVRAHNAERDKILAKLKKDAALREKYASVTRDQAQTADCRELLHGVALNIQQRLESESDLTAAFRALPAHEQYIYAWNYLFCEDADSLSAFFRLNGSPLTDAALEGARAVFGEQGFGVLERGFRMFDPDDETTSALPQDIETLDADFAAQQDVLLENIRTFIAAHTAE